MTHPDALTGKADLHTHTNHTDGMMDVPALLDRAQRHTDLDVLAVTDHDDITAGLRARELAAREDFRFQVIVGSEITTLGGHLIALFIEEPIPRLQSVERTLKAIHRQGGLAIAPHPMSWLTFSIGAATLLRVARSEESDVYFDGIETANASLAGAITRKKALRMNREELGFAVIGASDAHFLPCVGSGYTRFPGRTAQDVRGAIVAGRTEAVSRSVPLSEIGYGVVVQQQIRSLVVHPLRALSRPLRKYFGATS